MTDKQNDKPSHKALHEALFGRGESVSEEDATFAIAAALAESDPDERRALLKEAFTELRRRAIAMGNTDALNELQNLEVALLE